MTTILWNEGHKAIYKFHLTVAQQVWFVLTFC